MQLHTHPVRLQRCARLLQRTLPDDGASRKRGLCPDEDANTPPDVTRTPTETASVAGAAVSNYLTAVPVVSTSQPEQASADPQLADVVAGTPNVSR